MYIIVQINSASLCSGITPERCHQTGLLFGLYFSQETLNLLKYLNKHMVRPFFAMPYERDNFFCTFLKAAVTCYWPEPLQVAV